MHVPRPSNELARACHFLALFLHGTRTFKRLAVNNEESVAGQKGGLLLSIESSVGWSSSQDSEAKIIVGRVRLSDLVFSSVVVAAEKGFCPTLGIRIDVRRNPIFFWADDYGVSV